MPGPTKSDKELLTLLSKAAEQQSELRLMRIGGPRKFRYDVFNFTKDKGDANSNTIKALQSKDISFIKILLANPNGEAFLKRLDTEGASTWKIWRVLRHIFIFAEKLFMLNENISIALHNEELIWNLGIVGDKEVLVTPYGLGTGHDSSAQLQWINESEHNQLATAFCKYFEAIEKKQDTIWLERGEVYAKSSPRWPSLFKGNAILANEEDRDGTDEPKLKQEEVCKICENPISNIAEQNWLSISEGLRRKNNHFRAGLIKRQFDDRRGSALVIQRYPGPTLFELATYLNQLSSKDDESEDQCAYILQAIYEDSLLALSEFQGISDSVSPSITRITYPYEKKLRAAIQDIKRHFPEISHTIWEEALEETSQLGIEMEEASSVPFRDAHLKNRIWNKVDTKETIVDTLLKMDKNSITAYINQKVIDIDFETACYNVTPYDDFFHILFFEHSVFDSFISLSKKHELYSIYKRKNDLNLDLYFWRTGLARSLREYCRRLWYRAVMPNTYLRRYSLESPDYFLRLALECSSRSSGYLKIRKLLESLEKYTKEPSRQFVFINALEGFEISTENRVPELRDLPSGSIGKKVDNKENVAVKVFISYAHQDEQYRIELGKTLKMLKHKNIIEVWHDGEIHAGMEWDKTIREKMYESDLIIFIVSRDFLASTYINEIEVPIALEMYKEKAVVVVPIIARHIILEDKEIRKFKVLPSGAKPISDWDNQDLAWVNVEHELKKIVSDIWERQKS